MLRTVAAFAIALLIGSAMAQTGEVRVPDIASTPLPRAIHVGGTTYVDKGLVATGSLAAGRHALPWNLRDKRGAMRPGVVFVRLLADRATVLRRMVVLE